MKLSQVLVTAILFLALLSCREPLVNSKDSVPEEGPGLSPEEELDNVRPLKEHKKSKAVDTLKPRIVAILKS